MLFVLYKSLWKKIDRLVASFRPLFIANLAKIKGQNGF